MINKKMLQDDRRNKLNFLINKYNFYLQEVLFDYIKDKICNIKNNIKNGNVSKRDRIYYEGVVDTCKEIMKIMRRKNDNKE